MSFVAFAKSRPTNHPTAIILCTFCTHLYYSGSRRHYRRRASRLLAARYWRLPPITMLSSIFLRALDPCAHSYECGKAAFGLSLLIIMLAIYMPFQFQFASQIIRSGRRLSMRRHHVELCKDTVGLVGRRPITFLPSDCLFA